MNKDMFLPQDMQEVVMEYRAAWTCIGRVEESLMNGDFAEAKLTLNDLSKSIREIEKLHVKKQRHNDLVDVVKQLAKRGLIVKFGVRS